MNDADNLIVVLVITAPDADGRRTVAPVIRAAPGQHAGSEFTGPVLVPSGTRFLGWAGLGVGALGWWAPRSARALGEEPTGRDATPQQ